MDPMTLILVALLAVMVIFMFRNSRKRKADAEALQQKMVPGAEVMTNFGLYGTLVEIDEENNVAHVEVAPGTTVRVHRQVLARVVEETQVVADDEPVAEVAADEPTVEGDRRTKSDD
jgi:preprotein translocase subunit YajC